MIRAVACIGLLTLLSGAAFRQSAEKPPAFDAADVHVSPARTLPVMVGGVLRSGRYEVENATMLELIRTAYGVTDDKVFGGPSWLELDRFDVIAKAPTGATAETAKVMLQTLLADRFKLTFHNESKPVPVYVLTAGKGNPKLKAAADTGPAGCQGHPQENPPAPGALPPNIVVSCHGLTMAAFAEQVHQMAGGYLDHPVLDSTKLEGSWDFDIQWTARGLLAAAGSDGISIFDAVDKQLGLKLELQNAPMPVLVVDKVNEKPTDNLPGVGKELPAVRPEFEVADVKVSAPGEQRNYIRPSPGGRWDATGPLRNTIGFAFDIPGNLRPDLMVVPKWVETYYIDVIAKAPSAGPSAAGAGGRGGPAGEIADDVTLRKMVYALLVDRFKLQTHFEDRQATVYAIVVPKGEPKLKKADDSERSGCKPIPAPPVPGNTGPMNALRCVNTTLAQLAHNLPLYANGYIDHPVVDTTTGLQGGWDFTLSWTPRGFLDNPGPRPADAPGGLVTAPDLGGVSIFEAMEKQLGLKLEVQKHAISVLVVDHVEELHQ